MKVDVGYLHRADALSPGFSFSLLMLSGHDARSRQRIGRIWNQESSANISMGRCDVVRSFLAGNADWLWMVDSDMTFSKGILDRLLRAGQTGKPIVGGLCFGVRPRQVNGVDQFNETQGSDYEAFPTLYRVDEAGRRLPWFDYPRDQIVEVASTGAACLLMHRDVLADGRWQTDGHPLPWFREAVASGGVMSEDHFFCAKAHHMGYKLHVDTGAKCGHVKPLVVDEDFYDRTRV